MVYITKFKHLTKNFFKIIYYKVFKKTNYTLSKIRKNEILIHHHLGLGDTIICNGMINFLSNHFEKIVLPTKKNIINQIRFLYSENKKIEVIEISDEKEIYNSKYEVLRVGFEKNFGKFNISFYNQLDLPYEYSFKYFNIPENKLKTDQLFRHLLEVYSIEKEFQLVHNTSSYGKVDLKLNDNLKVVYVEKNTDIFQNIFLYTELIKFAKEIHCIDSSFLHLVERVNSSADLYFHPIKKNGQVSEKLYLLKDWNIIN